MTDEQRELRGAEATPETTLLDPAGDEHPADTHWKGGIYAGIHARPWYYVETHHAVLYLKAIILALVAVGPYYLVLDQIGGVKALGFEPCNNKTCTYMRLLGQTDLPGTGVSFIAVRNGVNRNVALQLWPLLPMKAYTVVDDNHTVGAIMVDNVTAKDVLHHTTLGEMEKQQKAVDEFTPLSQASLLATAPFTKVLMQPFSLFGQYFRKPWGMQAIISPRCGDKEAEDMEEICSRDSVKKKIYNHLKTGKSRWVVMAGIILWLALMIVHDFMLLSERFEEHCVVPLYVGAVSILCQGVACISMFIWATAATEVFGSKDPDGNHGCMCYYQLQPLQSLMALSTPFMMLFDWAARLQIWGMSCLYGDYMYTSKFIVPHHLAKQTMLWSWALLISPKVTGTTKADKTWYNDIVEQGQKRGKNHFDMLYFVMSVMYVLRFIALLTVAVAASPFMVRLKELLMNLARESHGSVNCMLRYAQLVPSLVTFIMAVWFFMSWWQKIVVTDLINAMRKREQPTPLMVRHFVFVCTAVPSALLALASVCGLWPASNYIFDPSNAKEPSLVQAELWGSCGFICFQLIIVQMVQEIYCLEEEMEMLRKVGDYDGNMVAALTSGKPGLT